MIDRHEYLGLLELSRRHVFYDTSVEPVLKKFTVAFSESTSFSRWQKTMSNWEFYICKFEFYVLLILIYHSQKRNYLNVYIFLPRFQLVLRQTEKILTITALFNAWLVKNVKLNRLKAILIFLFRKLNFSYFHRDFI